MRVLFLYTELADYFLKCCEKLAETAEVHIVHWPVNSEAPFNLSVSGNIKLYEKSRLSYSQTRELIMGIDPSVIICSGWIDKDYLRLTKPFYGKIPTVMSCDTHWKGSIKQRIATVLSRVFLLNRFSHAWVPGDTQKKYVLKLGFKESKIRKGFYSCDLEKFNKNYREKAAAKQAHMPKRFLFVGRYYQFKGVELLWDSFIHLQKENPNSWELWCLGIGDIEPIIHPKIKHFGFIQPQDLEPIISQCTVFVLPSLFEPWGVVVHEYAAAGFPLILSSAVGAGEVFLKEGKNGYGFEAGDNAGLVDAMKKVINLDSKELISMAQNSHELAQQISPVTWAQTVKEFMNEKK